MACCVRTRQQSCGDATLGKYCGSPYMENLCLQAQYKRESCCVCPRSIERTASQVRSQFPVTRNLVFQWDTMTAQHLLEEDPTLIPWGALRGHGTQDRGWSTDETVLSLPPVMYACVQIIPVT